MNKQQLEGLKLLVFNLKLARKGIDVSENLKHLAKELDDLKISWKIQNKVAAYIQHTISYEKMNDSYNMQLVKEAIA